MQSRLAEKGLVELASGVDALYLSGGPNCPALSRPPGGLPDLGGAGDLKLTRSVRMGGVVFGIAPHGWGKYRYCLRHEMARWG